MDNIQLIALDMSLAREHQHPEIKTDGTYYLVRFDSDYYAGTFHNNWYGLDFDGWNGTPLQFDAPGFNSSDWEQIWEIVDCRNLDRRIAERINKGF